MLLTEKSIKNAMFSSKERLIRRTGKGKPDRFEYLKLLTEEFKTTKQLDSKKQILANLANFAYDPINYEYIRQLGIIDLFLNQLESKNKAIVEFCIAGILNLCLDFTNKDHITKTQGAILAIKNCLASPEDEIVISAITTLMFLIQPSSKQEILTPDTVSYIVAFSKNPNPRISNLAKIFLDDYCTNDQVQIGSKAIQSALDSSKNSDS